MLIMYSCTSQTLHLHLVHKYEICLFHIIESPAVAGLFMLDKVRKISFPEFPLRHLPAAF